MELGITFNSQSDLFVMVSKVRAEAATRGAVRMVGGRHGTAWLFSGLYSIKRWIGSRDGT